MINNLKLSVMASFLVLLPAVSFGQQTWQPKEEKGKVIYIDKKTGALRSKAEFSQKITHNGIIYIDEKAKGDYDRYKDIIWNIKAECREKYGILMPIDTVKTIKNKSGNIIVKYKKKFDYKHKRIHYTKSNEKGIALKRVYPIKGKICDETTLTNFLKVFAANLGNKSYRQFYLITSEPKLYRITLKNLGQEKIKFKGREITAVKLRLIPNFGLLTGITKVLIPPTFVWYTTKAPYVNLGYQGLERGLGSKIVRVELKENSLLEKYSTDKN